MFQAPENSLEFLLVVNKLCNSFHGVNIYDPGAKCPVPMW